MYGNRHNEWYGVVTRYGLDNTGFDLRQSQVIFLSSRASRPALVLPQPPFPWARGSFPGIRPPGCDADHSRPSVEVRMSETTSALPMCLYFVHRDGFILCLERGYNMQLLPSNIFVECKTAIWRSFEIFFYLLVCRF
jgi:hypothetical protein